MQSVEEIEHRLRKAGVPEPQILFHVNRVTKWRKAHIKIKRKRLDWPVSVSGYVLRPKRKRAQR